MLLLLLATALLAQTNPLVASIQTTVKENLLYTLAQAYCKSKVAWDALTYAINNIGSSLEQVKPQFDQLVGLLEPGGALYNDMVSWSNTYVNNYNTFKTYVTEMLINARGLVTALHAGATLLATQNPKAARPALLNNYAAQINDIITAASNYLQAYKGLETMQQLSDLARIIHPKEVLVLTNATNLATALLLVNSGNVTAMIPPPANTWLSLAACATDFTNNSFILCVALGASIANVTAYKAYYLYFNSPFYLNVYSPGLGAPCPINSAQMHTYIVNLWNLYNTIYNYYIANLWPYEMKLINTKNVLISILTSLGNDLLQPILSAITLAGKTQLPGALQSCMGLVKTQTSLNTLSNYDPRDPTQLYAFLSNAAQSFSSVFDSVLNAIKCMQYYLPYYERAENAYLTALAERFKQLSGGQDVVTWAEQHGIQCTYTPPVTLTHSLSTVINTYYSLLNPNSPTSFLKTLTVGSPENVLAPNEVPVGPAGSPCG